MTADHGGRATPAPIGLFDKHIACAACESLFAHTDQVAIEFRRGVLTGSIPPVRIERSPDPKLGLIASYDVDASKLHSFAMFTLYRAFLSGRPECRQVAAPWIEEEVRQRLIDGHSTIDTGRDVVIIFVTHPLAAMAGSPVHMSSQPDFYRLILPHMNILIADEGISLPTGFQPLRLESGMPVTVWNRPLPLQGDVKFAVEAIGKAEPQVDRILAAMSRRRADSVVKSD
ncbi:hypothetical protein [Pseudoxanthomonas suwonensis]|uniref:hypothetical protein n=1 Tax=Pseudoxanthomonas suwonensis TaxID=314722 RepID=UPI001186876C|nr:hypothetical protein [Pseudoxanthomonas suwonensis]